MGYKPQQVFKFSFDKLNTVSGELEVCADTLRDAEKLLKSMGVLELVKYVPNITEIQQPPRKI